MTPGPLDGPAGRPAAGAVVNSSDSPSAVNVIWPATTPETPGAAPDVVTRSGPVRGMAIAGDVNPRQSRVADLGPSLTRVLSAAVSVTVDACSPARAATAACGNVKVIPVPVGRIGWPAFVAAGEEAGNFARPRRDAAGDGHA